MTPASALACLVLFALAGGAREAGDAAGPDDGAVAVRATARFTDGFDVYVERCSTCHGLDGEGTDLGPDIRNAGAAAADFQTRTGRMPLDDPDEQAVRRQPVLTPSEIDAVTAYVAQLGDGPPIPEVHPETANLQAGNEAFILNCAACHGFAGRGGNLGRGVQALSLLDATPVQIAEAMRTGPGEMPVFPPTVFDDRTVDDVVAYVLYLQDPANRGGAQIGLAGPIPEGFIAVLFGLGILILVTRWIGERRA